MNPKTLIFGKCFSYPFIYNHMQTVDTL